MAFPAVPITFLTGDTSEPSPFSTQPVLGFGHPIVAFFAADEILHLNRRVKLRGGLVKVDTTIDHSERWERWERWERRGMHNLTMEGFDDVGNPGTCNRSDQED